MCAVAVLGVHGVTNKGYSDRPLLLALPYKPLDNMTVPPAEVKRLVDHASETGVELVVGCDTNSHNMVWGCKDTNAKVVMAEWKNLRVKYALWDGFYKIPQSLNDATTEFVKMSHDDDLNVDLYSYPNDPRVSVLFDSYGNIAGLRTAYIEEDVPKRAESKGLKFEYTYNDKPIFMRGNYWNTSLWYTSVLFVRPEKLKAGGRKESKGLVAEDIFLKLNGNWTLIPKDECKVEELGFTKQGCFLGMGKHYFYRVTPTSECKDYQGVFLLYESGELIGLGINPFGSFTSKERVWFEDVPAKIVKTIVADGPECLETWVENFGVTSLHIFFKNSPRLTFCTWPWQKDDRCEK